MKLKILIFFIGGLSGYTQQIGDFISITPQSQNSAFVIPSTHTFQKFIETGDALTQGGTLKTNNDFTGYVPIGGSSINGYLSINAETNPGGVSVLDINFNGSTKLWEITRSEAIDFSGVGGTLNNCSGTVTPWNTVISCEETIDTSDSNADGYNDGGWAVEINPVTKMVINKLWALGNIRHENVTVHSNQRTVYEGTDAPSGYLYKFVADNAQDLSSGALYVYSGSKNGAGSWVRINNTTKDDRNNTMNLSSSAGGTPFNGIEDVEVGPDGWVYFAVKNESCVYRFQDSDPITGTTVLQMETYVGKATYTISHENGPTDVPWGSGNDNLAFDGDGNLWVLQDGGSKNYIWVVENGHTQAVPKVRIFGNPPAGSEPTGITFSPDYRFLFMSVQHPNSNNNGTQIDAAGNTVNFNNGTTLVLARKEQLGAEATNPVWYLDADNDGYAAADTVTGATSPGPGYTTTVLPTTDCDDSDATINPETIWYLDGDGDGFATAVTVTNCTSPGLGYTTNVLPTTDCDDNDPSVNEISTWYLDADGDGFADPTTVENCGTPGPGYSTNVLPNTDCDDNDASVNESATWYLDADGDGFADPTTVESCTNPGAGYSTNVMPATDCDDNDASVNESSTWYLDADGDGFADPTTVESCVSPGTGYSINELPATDCDDNDGSVNTTSTWYLDTDADGFADNEPITSCASPGEGYTTVFLPPFPTSDGSTIIFPNPTKGNITIDLGKMYTIVTVSVVNVLNQMVFMQRFDNVDAINIDLTNRAEGVYFLKVTSESNKVDIVKIIRK